MELRSLNLEGEAAGGGTFGPSVSANGRYVAYASFASDIVADDTNDAYDIFVHDRVLGTTTRAMCRARVPGPKVAPASSPR